MKMDPNRTRSARRAIAAWHQRMRAIFRIRKP